MNIRLFFRSGTLVLAFLCLFFFPFFSSFAASEAFPSREIFIQFLNFSMFFAAFLFLCRKPIKVFFHKRQEEFFSFEKQALSLEKEKKKELKLWEDKLAVLKDQEKGIKKKAQEEGEKFVRQKKEELESLKTRLKRETDFFFRLEKEKAKKDFLRNWKDKIIQSAERKLEEEAVSPAFQTNRFKNFLKQLESHFGR